MTEDWKKYSRVIHYNGINLSRKELLGIDPEKYPAWESEHIRFMQKWVSDVPWIEVATSGSTGLPQKIHLAKNTMIASAHMTCNYLGINPGDQAVLCLPSRYIGGKMMIVRAFVRELQLSSISPNAAPSISSRADLVAMTPHQLSGSLHESPQSLSLIGNLLLGGSPTPRSLEEQLQHLACRCFSTYGMTETSSHIALRPINGPNRSEWYETLDPAIRLSTDDQSCLCIEAPFLEGSKLVTRDIVRLIDDRRFIVLGRLDNVINSGGIKLQAESIERKLKEMIDFPFIVFGEKHPIYGERPALLIEKNRSEQLPRIERAINTQLSRLEKPGSIHVVVKLAETENGKIKRTESIERSKRLKTLTD
jgi:O-succinylbenzoic acid--CoA ligase